MVNVEPWRGTVSLILFYDTYLPGATLSLSARVDKYSLHSKDMFLKDKRYF
jgi:hypothetical protein